MKQGVNLEPSVSTSQPYIPELFLSPPTARKISIAGSNFSPGSSEGTAPTQLDSVTFVHIQEVTELVNGYRS
jgi:3-isopropylmalate dehydratase small subunit